MTFRQHAFPSEPREYELQKEVLCPGVFFSGSYVLDYLVNYVHRLNLYEHVKYDQTVHFHVSYASNLLYAFY